MTDPRLTLSVLDLIPVHSTQTSAQALSASLSLAQGAEALGYHRYWVAEHHNMEAVASTNPAVLLGLIGSRTQRIRLGSGGVMLPNHAPLVVAEQFALLEAAFPGRVDLGLGRAPGSDPVITALLRQSGAVSEVEAFERNVLDIGALLNPEGAALQLRSGQVYGLRATPRAASTPRLWILGSSDYSARLAARQGLPYVFAHHFSGDEQATGHALSLYRQGFTPTEALPRPQAFIGVNVSVAPTREEAYAQALPQLQLMARLRSGLPLGPVPTVEEAEATTMGPLQQELMDDMARRWIIDAPAAAAERLRDLARRHELHELMVVPYGAARAGSDPSQAAARIRTLQLLAEAMG
ncbi:LLM class flavin-dependent oxidoreductase [Aggregicoccus sp. 17bor-14]|uniref:LLM class flavin-dependent oxidoreductase n=1 Tax=Myxococcaceae TaxID=31 RepID=UPI00129C683D|nr:MULTISPECIES: LLM class flavin-dependent oxidoreductase [Myxococcaceae]MBF5044945.1 LLM class flavin-dependent oxidoreductase [Simulacricoccus sp. 17bor-14]MRI90688.1 LLM class flavin-dependent oxidoreductase [Aggregicoccus sp. 17bor-14]